MKLKHVLFTSIALLLCVSAKAQSPLNLGVKAGLNYSMVGTSFENNSREANGGFTGGAFGRFKFKEYSIQGEVLFVTRSGAIAYNNINNVEQLKRFQNNTIDINLLFGYKFLDVGVVKLRGLIGASNSQSVYQGGNLVKGEYETGVYSGLIGLSLDVPFVIVEVRYQHGFSPFYEGPFHDGNTPQTNPIGKVRNNMLHFTVGYKFL